MARKPTKDDLELAIGWLEVNEGSGGEAEACKRVADWLDEMIGQDELRAHARRAGVPVAAVRRRLKEREAG